MSMEFLTQRATRKSCIAVLHMPPLPGSPRYEGKDVEEIYESCTQEALLLEQAGFDALLLENFGDAPFYPDKVPVETVTAMAIAAREVRNAVSLPLGINVLRNDSQAALAIATFSGAQFIRVNIHLHAYVTDQGLIEGKGHLLLRLRQQLRSSVAIFADVHTKHGTPLGKQSLAEEALDLQERGLVDGLILTGKRTGEVVDFKEARLLRQHYQGPLFVGSGLAPSNLDSLFSFVDGGIVSSFIRQGGRAGESLDTKRMQELLQARAHFLSTSTPS